MSSVGHPIVGDVAYGSKVKSERILLHAKSLTFVSGGKELIFETELPAEFSI
jgi:23S rRNA-/tRNA-specific pseudouridylate synthase